MYLVTNNIKCIQNDYVNVEIDLLSWESYCW